MLTLLFNEKYCKQAVMKGEMSNINGKYYFWEKKYTTTMLPDYINVISIDNIDNIKFKEIIDRYG